jgi:hypothetical protein
MTALLIFSTTDTKGPTHRNNQVKRDGERGRRASSKSVAITTRYYIICGGNSENRDGRTFGGMPLMTGIKRIYKKRAMVKRPENTERPTRGLRE